MSLAEKIMHHEKLQKKAGAEVTALDIQVASEILNLQKTAPDLLADLKDLKIAGAKEIDVDGAKKAIIVWVPFTQIKDFHKRDVHTRLVRELEKKFSGKHVVFVAQRTILPKTFNRGKVDAGVRPRSRTLTAVHEAILEDIAYPTEIVGKRTRYADGNKQLQVFLDAKDTHILEAKLDTFSKVYFELTNKEVQFAFPVENP